MVVGLLIAVAPGTPTWIWAVAVYGDLYVRGYNGQGSRWYQAARRQKARQITAAGATRNVLFEPVAGAINDRVDEAYRTKYRGSAYLAPMIGDSAPHVGVHQWVRQTARGQLDGCPVALGRWRRGVDALDVPLHRCCETAALASLFRALSPL